MGKKVLFVNQEIIPYVPETEMSLFGSEMPTKMQEAGFEIRIGNELDYRRYRPSSDYQGGKYSTDTHTGLFY